MKSKITNICLNSNTTLDELDESLRLLYRTLVVHLKDKFDRVLNVKYPMILSADLIAFATLPQNLNYNFTRKH